MCAERARPRAGTPSSELPIGLALAIILAAAAIVHGSALGGGFAADDFDFLLRVRGLDHSAWSWARPLPGVLRWTVVTRLFGVWPLPHLLLALAFHVASAVLVFLTVRDAGQGSRAAVLAGVAIAASAVAYTSTHWASGLGELMATTFVTGALFAHLQARRTAHPLPRWVAGACAVGAVFSKESAVLLPVACFAFDRWVCPRGPGRGALREVAVLGGLSTACVFALWWISPQVAGEAYALSASPAHWLANLFTYCAWLVRAWDPIRDRSATVQPGLFGWGATVFAAWTLLAFRERVQRTRPIGTGLVVFLLMIAPVIPLAQHSYLYYLLTPLVGACLAAAGCFARLERRLPAPAANLLLVLLGSAYVGNEAFQVHARATLAFGGIVVDRMSRESGLVRNSIADLRAAGVARDTIVLLAPFRRLAVNATAGVIDSSGSGFSRAAYIPLVSALREGRVIPLYLPDVTVLGMGDSLPREWERARAFVFDNDGHLADIGRGADALDSLCVDFMEAKRWTEVRDASTRLIELGRDGPELRWRLGAALAQLGDERGGVEQAQLLLSRWPDSPRASMIRENANRARMRP